MKIATCRASSGSRDANIRFMRCSAGSMTASRILSGFQLGTDRSNEILPMLFPKWDFSTTDVSTWNVGSYISACLFFRPVCLDQGDGAFQPVLDVFQTNVLGLRRPHGCALTGEGYVVTGNFFCPVLLGNEVIEDAFTAGMRTRRVSMVGTGKRILEDGRRAPWGAVPVAVTTLFQEIQFVPQHFQYITLVIRHPHLQLGRWFCACSGSRQLCSGYVRSGCDLPHYMV